MSVSVVNNKKSKLLNTNKNLIIEKPVVMINGEAVMLGLISTDSEANIFALSEPLSFACR